MIPKFHTGGMILILQNHRVVWIRHCGLLPSVHTAPSAVGDDEGMLWQVKQGSHVMPAGTQTSKPTLPPQYLTDLEARQVSKVSGTARLLLLKLALCNLGRGVSEKQPAHKIPPGMFGSETKIQRCMKAVLALFNTFLFK